MSSEAPADSSPNESREARRHSPWMHLVLWVGALLVILMLRLLGATYRVDLVIGEERLREMIDRRRQVLLTLWHEGAFFLGYFLWRHVLVKGVPVTLQTSQSRDGELSAKVARLAGIPTVRGSTTRGGKAALRRLYWKIIRQGGSPITIPDGPQGPPFFCKPGVVVLAQMSRAPVLPLSFAVERPWKLRSWDRLMVPRPFSRVAVAIGEPIEVPRSLSEEEFENRRLEVENVLNRLGERIAALLAGAGEGGEAQ